MTIVIECTLESAVFFPGDTIFCRISISNKSNNPFPTTNNNNNNPKELLSWITTQVYGNVVSEPTYIKSLSDSNKKKKDKTKPNTPGGNNNSSNTNNSNNNSHSIAPPIHITTHPQALKRNMAGISSATSLPNINESGVNTKPIFASPITFLISDLMLQPGQTRSYIYYLTLPTSLPPSYKGTGIKYSYFLSIAAQLYTNPAQILTVPIRVLTPALKPIKFKTNMNFDYEEGSTETTLEISKNPLEVVSKWPVSPFKKSQYFPVPYPQTLSQYDSNNARKSVIDVLNKFSNPVTINISKGVEKLATFSICKTAFNLGDSVCGTFDFSIGTLPCYKVLVKLECEEIIDPKYLHQSRVNSNSKPIRKLYGELHEYTTNIRQTHFMFHIPVEAPQEFQTKYVSVKWSLRFEFVTPTKQPNLGGSSNSSFINPSSSSTNSPHIKTPNRTPPNEFNEEQQVTVQNNNNSNHMNSNRSIAEVPSDNESSHSSINMVNEETINSSGGISRSSSISQFQPLKKKSLSQQPIIGVLKDDGTLPVVDTLHWSLPIRVLVSSPPHELLHTNKNELILI